MQQVRMREGFALCYTASSQHGKGLVLAGGEYETAQTELVKATVGPEWHVFDIGAALGYYSMLTAKAGAIVTAFEPRLSSYQALTEGVRVNEASKFITAYRLAVGDSTGVVSLGLNSGNDTDSRLVSPVYWPQEPVYCVTLDSAMPCISATPGKVFIKIDVQGSELAVLRGAAKLLAQFHPTILIEDSPEHVRLAGETENLRDVLTRLGYNWQVVTPRGQDFCDLWCIPHGI